jgi:hypothetical protein
MRIMFLFMKELLLKTFARAVWAGLLITVVGIGLVVTFSDSTKTSNIVLTNLGLALMTIGLAGVVYDVLLRRLLIEEVLEATGMGENLRAFGLLRIDRTTDFNLEMTLRDAATVTIFPLDPVRWIDHDFETVLRVAKERALEVTLILPANESRFVDVLADRIDKPVGDVAQTLDDVAAGKLGSTWTRFDADLKSSLKVFRYEGVPATGLILTDRIVATQTGPLIRYREHDRQDFYVVAGNRSPGVPWVKEQIEQERKDGRLSKVDDVQLRSGEAI